LSETEWKYEIGPCDAMKACDDLFISRFILHRIGEELGMTIKFELNDTMNVPNKIPLTTTNTNLARVYFSTREMNEQNYVDTIEQFVSKLSRTTLTKSNQFRFNFIKKLFVYDNNCLYKVSQLNGINGMNIAMNAKFVQRLLYNQKKDSYSAKNDKMCFYNYLGIENEFLNFDPYFIVDNIFKIIYFDKQ
jgi:hypothetical protein